MLVPEAVVISAVVATAAPGHHARYQPSATVACTELPSLRSIVTLSAEPGGLTRFLF